VLNYASLVILGKCIEQAHETFEKNVSRINHLIKADLKQTKELSKKSSKVDYGKTIQIAEDFKNPELEIGITTVTSDSNDELVIAIERQELSLRPEDIKESINNTTRKEKNFNRYKSNALLDAKLTLSQEHLEESLKKHMAQVRKWCSTFSFRDLKEPRKLSNNYIELESYLIPRENHYCKSECSKKRKLVSTVLNDPHHAIVLGTPGAGKTTSMKKVASHIFDEKHQECQQPILLIRFRALKHSNSKSPLLDAINDILECKFTFNDDFVGEVELEKLKFQVITKILNEANCLLILEGYDEISENLVKNQVQVEIRKFAAELDKARMVITCRTGEFRYDIDNLIPYEIAPLNHSQIIEFSDKWLGGDSQNFITELRVTPYYDTVIRPLTLGHLCAIYERYKSIPEKPKTIYKKVVNLLLEEWDEQRSITRESKYAKFEIDQKFELLSNIAFELTANGARGEFTDEQLRSAYSSICKDFGLSDIKSEAEEVIREIESHTGIFIRSGVDKFEFSHKSIQEFLTADYLVRLPLHFIDDSVIEELGTELAVATSISSNSSLYLSDVLLNIYPRQRLNKNFIEPFLSRLVIEKPDFSLRKDLAVAILYLMSCGKFTDGNFKILFKDFLNEESLSCLKDLYVYDTRNMMTETIILKKCGNLNNYKTPYNITIRNELDLIYSVFAD